MDSLRAVDGDPVPRTVWIVIGVLLVWSIGPLIFLFDGLPDLLRGDIHGRRVRASDWFSSLQWLLFAAVFWFAAYRIHQRSRRGWFVLVVLGGVALLGAVLGSFIDEFSLGFLLGSLAYAVPLAAVGFLPGVKQWCHNLF